MKKKYKRVLTITIILIILVLIVMLLLKVFNKKEKNIVNVIDSMDNYNYALEDRDTPLYKNVYNELKEVLKQSDVDFKKYASNLAKLYIIDLYTLDNKISKYDVGGSDFIYPDALDNYKLNVEETIYKIIENNIDGKRKQNLPEVKNIDVKDDVEEIKYQIGEREYNGYKVHITWEYVKDLGYDKEAEVFLIKSDHVLFIVEQKGVS